MFRSRRFWFGIAVSSGFLALFLIGIDYAKTGQALRDANYAYIIPGILIYFVSLWFRTLRWQYLLRHLCPIPIRRLYPIMVVGYMANNILPVRLGEVARSFYLGEKEKVSKSSSLATILIERVFDGLILILFVLVVWPFLPLGDLLRTDAGDLRILRLTGTILVGSVFVVVFVGLVAVALYPPLGQRISDLLTFFVPTRFKDQARRFVELFLGGLASLRSAKKLLIILLLSAPIWLIEALTYYIVSFSFDIDVSFGVILVATATSNLISAVPSTAGGIGPFELATKVTLVSFGVNTESAVAYAAALHLALWLPVVAAGILLLWMDNRSLIQFFRGPTEAHWPEGYPIRPVPLEGDGKE